MADNLAHPYNRRRVLTIDDLPDDDLLEIFDFYVVVDLPKGVFGIQNKRWSWQSLVHVCRRWRGLVFDSPRRLNLQLFCTTSTPARKTLDVWPALPLLIQGMVLKTSVDNVITVLEHSDRISQIDLASTSMSHRENLWTAMQVPFPVLAALRLSRFSCGPVLPDSFLGGSAPRLRSLVLTSIPFPGLPKLLLSATHLVELCLYDIPHSGYFSPEAMVTCLSTLTSLKILHLRFKSPQSSPEENRRSPPPTRSFFPALTKFGFQGVNKYLEDLVSRIDSPRLYRFSTTFFHDIDFDSPELNQFISRTPALGAYNEARLIFSSQKAGVRLRSHPGPSDPGMVEVKILCEVPDRQLSSLAQICTSSLRRLLLTMENLYIDAYPYTIIHVWAYNIANTEWLDLLLPFMAVKNVYVSKEFSPCIATALQELTGGRITEVFPALQNVLLEGFQPSEPVEEGIAQLVAARQLCGHPVAVSLWERDSDSDED